MRPICSRTPWLTLSLTEIGCVSAIMPGLVRSLLVAATVDGLILQPLHQRNPQSLHIKYATHEITYTGRRPNQNDATQECHGIIGTFFRPFQAISLTANRSIALGLLKVPPLSFLITITHRRQVAEISGLPVFVICNVSLIPLSSRLEATNAIKLAKTSSSPHCAQPVSDATDSEDSDGDGETTGNALHDNGEAADVSPVTASPAEEVPLGPESSKDHRATSNVARDVLGRKGQYGRFAEKWFSRKGWSVERRRVQGMSVDEQESSFSTLGDRSIDRAAGSLPAEEFPYRTPKTYSLLPKLLRTTKLLFSSQSFFFSYDLDITRRVGSPPPKGSDLPLIMAVDPLVRPQLQSPISQGC